jgi:hypothetical protein
VKTVPTTDFLVLGGGAGCLGVGSYILSN